MLLHRYGVASKIEVARVLLVTPGTLRVNGKDLYRIVGRVALDKEHEHYDVVTAARSFRAYPITGRVNIAVSGGKCHSIPIQPGGKFHVHVETDNMHDPSVVISAILEDNSDLKYYVKSPEPLYDVELVVN